MSGVLVIDFVVGLELGVGGGGLSVVILMDDGGLGVLVFVLGGVVVRVGRSVSVLLISVHQLVLSFLGLVR